ncbi:MAG: YadA-like family protein [Veillonella sp.]|nr:YadA-like family protein [Veillonella sp.]
MKKATTTVTANAGEAANATTGNVTLTSTTAADGHTIYDVKLNDKVTLGSGANAVTIDGTAGKATIGSSVVDGVNNTFTTGGANAIKLDGAAGTIKTGTVTVTGGTTNDITGLSNTTVTAADFATKGRAATEEQLKAVGEQTWQITADKDTATSGVQTGTKKDAKVGKDDKVQLIAGENMTVNQNERDFTFILNKDLVKMNSATFLGTGSNTTVITGNSITQTAGTQTNTSTAGGNTVADGTKSTETTAAGQVIKDGAKSNKSTVDNNVIDDGNGNVNTSNATSNTITDGTNTTEATVSTLTVKDNAGNSTVITKDNVTTGVGGNKITLDGTAGKATIGSSIIDGVNNTFTTGGTNAVKLDGAAGTIKTGTVTVTGGMTNDITGLSNTTVTATDFATKGRAATEEQLKAVGEQTWQITADKDATTSGAQTGTKKDAKVGKDNKVQLIAGENMTINQNERDFTFTLNKDLVKMNSATFLGTGSNTTVITGNSITQTAGTQTNTSTAGGNTVADGTKSTETTAAGQVIKDGAKTNKSTVDTNVIDDGNGNVNTSNATSNTITDGTNTTEATASTLTVKDNAGNSTVITKDNVTTGVGGNKITLDGTVGKATIGSSVVDGVNNTFTTGGTNAVTMNGAAGTIKTGTVTVTGGATNDITGLSNTSVNSADFATKGRAATEEQLKAVGEQTWQITADKDATTSGAQTGTKKDAKVGKDNKVQLIAGENMTINQNERDFTFTLNKDLVKMNSATFLGTGSNTTVITGNSITQTAGTQANTSTAAGNTIANGTKSIETTADGQVIKDGAKSNKSTVDSNVIDDGNGNKNTSNATSNTITDGTNTSTITAGKANIGNIAVDGVNNKITMGNGATPVTLDGANGHLDGLTNTTWVPGVTKATTGRAATEDQLQQVSDAVGAGWKVNTGTVAGSSGVSNGAASTKVSSGEEVKLQAGDNLVIDQNGKTVSYSLNKDLTKMNSATFEATGGKTTVIKGDSIVQTDGGKTNTSNAAGNTVVDGNKSTATTAAGTTITDGAKTNTSTADKNVINDGAGNTNTATATSNTLADNAGNTNVSNATSNTLKNAAGDETKADAKGVTVKDAAGNNAIFTKDGITITKTGKDTVSLTSNGLDNGKNKIVNVAAGVANTDAVNVGQLKEYAAKSTTELTANNGETAGNTKGNIVLTKTTAADGHTIYDNKLNDKITLGAADPTKAVTVDGTAGTIAVADKITLNGKDGKAGIGTVGIDGKDGIITTGGTNSVKVDGSTGTVTGLTNKTWTPGSIVSGRAATEDQLKSAVADSGWKVTVDSVDSGKSTVVGTSPEKIKAEETVTFKAGNNMVVTQTGKSISYAINPELTDMKSATFKDAAGNTTVTNGNGITITPGSANPTNPHAGPVSLTKDGLNNGNNQIKGVAPGTDPTDAVNVAQLNASNANTSQAINQVAGEVQHVGAHAAAMAALKPIQYDPLEPTQIMAGVGNYRGETAAALGLAHYTNENTMFNVGVSVGGNHNMVNAGVTHKFGYSPEKKNIPDRYKAGPISSVYVMQDEVSSLKKENAEQKYVIADQAARLTTLEAENEQQRRELAETKKGLDDLKAAVDKLLASKG